MTGQITNRKGQVLNIAESARACRILVAFDKECWWNAARAVRTLYRKRGDAFYVEGHAITKYGISCEHGWVELDGMIVDPTPSWHEPEDCHAFATAPVYFAGIRYTYEQLRRKPANPERMPFIHGDRFLGWRNEAYRRSYLDSMAFVFGPAFEKFFPQPTTEEPI
jgi:hypothetical protein